MREIKFRLWDKTEKEMIYLDKVGDRQHHTFGIRKDGSLDYYNLQNGSGGDEYILMQYTGLHDKNGTEIYEGDVVKFNNKTYQVEKAVNCPSIGLWDANNKHVQLNNVFCDEYEVTGNVYENPEL